MIFEGKLNCVDKFGSFGGGKDKLLVRDDKDNKFILKLGYSTGLIESYGEVFASCLAKELNYNLPNCLVVERKYYEDFIDNEDIKFATLHDYFHDLILLRKLEERELTTEEKDEIIFFNILTNKLDHIKLNNKKDNYSRDVFFRIKDGDYWLIDYDYARPFRGLKKVNKIRLKELLNKNNIENKISLLFDLNIHNFIEKFYNLPDDFEELGENNTFEETKFRLESIKEFIKEGV